MQIAYLVTHCLFNNILPFKCATAAPVLTVIYEMYGPFEDLTNASQLKRFK